MPPVEAAIKNALRNEADGFDAVWWPDHLMGWFPDSLWTEDLTPLARTQPNPHVHVDPLLMMAVASAQMTTAKVGVVVTDLIRRNPAVLAQTMVTIDHFAKGRAILGLGSGEKLNVTPYGMPFDTPVARLSEGIDILRLLWNSGGKPVEFEGRFHKLEHAVLGMAPYTEGGPPIWTAAHGPRMLELTGRKSDGWIPTKMTPAEYAEGLARIRKASVDAGRDRDAVTPALLGYVLVGPDEATVASLMERPLVRALCVLLSADVFRSLGVDPPLHAAGSGWHDFIPTVVPRDEALRIVDAIPAKVVDYYAFCGTPEQIADQVEEQYRAGLRHLILWNITAFGDPDLAGFSFRALRQIKDELRSR